MDDEVEDTTADQQVQETTKKVLSLMKTCMAVGGAPNGVTQIDSSGEEDQNQLRGKRLREQNGGKGGLAKGGKDATDLQSGGVL